jgi:hypothetical protein
MKFTPFPLPAGRQALKNPAGAGLVNILFLTLTKPALASCQKRKRIFGYFAR